MLSVAVRCKAGEAPVIRKGQEENVVNTCIWRALSSVYSQSLYSSVGQNIQESDAISTDISWRLHVIALLQATAKHYAEKVVERLHSDSVGKEDIRDKFKIVRSCSELVRETSSHMI